MRPLLLLLSFVLSSIFVFAQDCASITINGGNGQITVSGLSGAPIATVQVFNSSWASVFNQTYTNPSNSVVASPLTPGQYFVNVRLYTSAWASICEKGANATVTNSPPPPAEACGPTFQRIVGTTAGNEQSHAMTKSADGGYLVTGLASASGTTNHDGLIMKHDNSGNLLWSKTLGGAQQDFFNDVIPTADGGGLAAGRTNAAGISTYTGEAWLVRFDGSGNILWQKKYFVSGSSSNAISIASTSDGGFAVSGLFPNIPASADWMVLKLDANGNMQWQKKLGANNSDGSAGIIEDNRGQPGLVVCGYVYQGAYYDAVITKLDMAGTVLWTKKYDFDGRTNWSGPIYKVSDGLIFNAINSTEWSDSQAQPAVIKTDINGQIIWMKEYVIPNCKDARMTVLPDGGFMMVQQELPHYNPSDLYLMRADAAGNVMWSKKYPRPDNQMMQGLVLDGNFLVGAGYATAGAYNDVMLIKSDLDGKMGTCSTVNVSVSPRNPVIADLPFSWPVNTANTLATANTDYATTASNYRDSIFCADNCAPAVTISNVTISENGGSALVQVCLAARATSALLYSYSTANGTATSGSDFTGGTGTVTIAAGQTCGTITIPILNDATVEQAENFTVSIGSVSGTVTINDDDQPQGNCNGVTFTPGNNIITVSGITAAVATVQVFNSNWATVFNQTYTNAPGTVNVPIGAGTYQVKVTFYTSGWAYVCDKTENVTVINSCPEGTICVTNTCPSGTIDLNTAYSPILPAGTTVSWHTGTPATDANKMTPEQVQNVSVSGIYYAAIHISGANCYSATIPVNVTIVPCSSAALTNAVQTKIEGEMATRNITAFPNPFTTSVKVIIDSEKSERATITLMDVQGRQLKQMPVMLAPGSNTVVMDGLGQFSSGNYFLRINSGGQVKTMKLIRQQ
jgi:hypothetical protein